MSDSLREQMLKAGFKETPGHNKKKTSNKAKQHKNHPGKNKQSGLDNKPKPSSMERANIAQREAVAARKRVKAEIKAIIEAEKIEKTAGESTHSYLGGKTNVCIRTDSKTTGVRHLSDHSAERFNLFNTC